MRRREEAGSHVRLQVSAHFYLKSPSHRNMIGTELQLLSRWDMAELEERARWEFPNTVKDGQRALLQDASGLVT